MNKSTSSSKSAVANESYKQSKSNEYNEPKRVD